jgi:mannose-6-phosphate isomerase
MLYPFTFHPRFKERVWGGRTLETLYRKPLPTGVPIGESWEISDRPGDASVIANGAFGGRDLRWLMEEHGEEVLGGVPAAEGRFPLLCKILDARQALSLQVHPPEAMAARLGGEQKTEMWYIADADPGAELFVGLRRGVTREGFEEKLRSGHVADCFHRIAVHAGDTMFLPSGRVHAIGAGLVIFEIQQNSDTTYRVFDWNRVGLDGRPRQLHTAESLACIDFEDIEPSLVNHVWTETGDLRVRPLIAHRLFTVTLVESSARTTIPLAGSLLRIAAVAERRLVVNGGTAAVELTAGQFCLLPASLRDGSLTLEPGTRVLLVEPGTER